MAKTISFSLLSFNTLGSPFLAPEISLRYKKIAEIINKNNIDIICFQEVFSYNKIHLLQKELSLYHYCLFKKHFYGARGGLVIFSKIPIEFVTYYDFKNLGKIYDSSSYSLFVKNGILVVKLKTFPLMIADTHLITDYEFDYSEDNKYYSLVKKQVYEAASFINTLTQNNSVLLAGDFNMRSGSQLYKAFLKETKAVNIFQNYTTPTYFPNRLDYRFKAKKAERIDYIFYLHKKRKIPNFRTKHLFTKEVSVSSGKSLYLSDHIGLAVKSTISI